MPTKRGWLVVGAGAVLLLAAVLSGYRELAVLGAVALITVLASTLLVGRPGRAEAQRSIPTPRIAPGGEVRVRTSVRNTGRRSLRLAELVADAEGEQLVALPAVAAGASAETGYQVGAARRGVIELGPLRAGRSDPLGLAASQRGHGRTDRIWVHPRWEHLRAVPVGRVADPDGDLDGARAGTLTFHALREYVPGDDLRHIHWRSSARQDKLIVREYIDTSHTRLAVLVDDRPTPGGRARLDDVAEAAACVLATGVRSSLHCEAHLVSGRGRDSGAGLPALLDLLSEAEPAEDADLARAVRLMRTRPSGDTAVLIGGGLTNADLRLFAQLRSCYAGLVAVAMGDGPPPAAPAGVGLVTAADATSFVDRWNEAPWSR